MVWEVCVSSFLSYNMYLFLAYPFSSVHMCESIGKSMTSMDFRGREGIVLWEVFV